MQRDIRRRARYVLFEKHIPSSTWPHRRHIQLFRQSSIQTPRSDQVNHHHILSRRPHTRRLPTRGRRDFTQERVVRGKCAEHEQGPTSQRMDPVLHHYPARFVATEDRLVEGLAHKASAYDFKVQVCRRGWGADRSPWTGEGYGPVPKPGWCTGHCKGLLSELFGRSRKGSEEAFWEMHVEGGGQFEAEVGLGCGASEGLVEWAGPWAEMQAVVANV